MIADTVKRLRVDRGWTQVQLAERAGLTQGHVSMLEKGDRESIREETFARLAMAFGMTLDTLKEEVEKEGGKVAWVGYENITAEAALVDEISKNLHGLDVDTLKLTLALVERLRLAFGMRALGNGSKVPNDAPSGNLRGHGVAGSSHPRSSWRKPQLHRRGRCHSRARRTVATRRD